MEYIVDLALRNFHLEFSKMEIKLMTTRKDRRLWRKEAGPFFRLWSRCGLCIRTDQSDPFCDVIRLNPNTTSPQTNAKDTASQGCLKGRGAAPPRKRNGRPLFCGCSLFSILPSRLPFGRTAATSTGQGLECLFGRFVVISRALLFVWGVAREIVKQTSHLHTSSLSLSVRSFSSFWVWFRSF